MNMQEGQHYLINPADLAWGSGTTVVGAVGEWLSGPAAGEGRPMPMLIVTMHAHLHPEDGSHHEVASQVVLSPELAEVLMTQLMHALRVLNEANEPPH